MSPGVTVRPRRSRSCVCDPTRARTRSVVPTATIVPFLMATPRATESAASTVSTLPLISTRSAAPPAGCCACTAARNTAGTASHLAMLRTIALLAFGGLADNCRRICEDDALFEFILSQPVRSRDTDAPGELLELIEIPLAVLEVAQRHRRGESVRHLRKTIPFRRRGARASAGHQVRAESA